MRTDALLSLLYAAVAAILVILGLTVGYALGGPEERAPAPPPLRTTVTGKPYPEVVGKRLWNANSCGSCHNKSMKDDATGPALAGVADRWADYPPEDLRAWIRNSQSLIATGHPRAVAVWEAWNKATMSSYSNLTDEEIDHLLAYIKTPSSVTY